MLNKILGVLVLVLFTNVSVHAAAPHYVNPNNTSTDCNTTPSGSNCDGSTHAKGFRTLKNINDHTFAEGDDVYFLCGGTWQSATATGTYVGIDWSGNSGDRAIIGAYYMNGETPVVGVPAGGHKPIIDGLDAYPETTISYGALLHAAYKQYVTFQDIDLRNSRQIGINLGDADYFIVQRMTLNDTNSSGIMASQAASNGLIDSNLLIDTGTTTYIPGSVVDKPACLVVTQGANNITISNNIIQGAPGVIYGAGGGEAIGVYKDCHDITIYNNVVSQIRDAGIYIESKNYNIVVNNNLIYRTAGQNLVWAGGIAVNNEVLSGAGGQSDISIYNNMIVGCNFGIYIASLTDDPLSTYTNLQVYNNTIIDSTLFSFRIMGSSVNYVSGNYIRNNIAWLPSSGGQHFYSNSASIAGITWDHNLWAGGLSGTNYAQASGTGDVTTAPSLVKTSGYLDVTAGSLTLADGKFSSAASAGVDVGADTSALVTTDAFAIARPVNTVVDMGIHEWPIVEEGPVCGDTECLAPETCGDEDAGNECLSDCGQCASSFSCTDVSLLWNMEAAATIQYNLGADTSFSLNSAAAIHADANKSGTNGLLCATPNDNAQLTLADGLVVSRLEGSMAFWMKYNVAIPSTNATLMYAGKASGGSSIYLTAQADGNLALSIYSGSSVVLQTTGAGLTTGAWYFVIARWNHAANDRFLGVYNDSGVLIKSAENLTTSWTAPPYEFDVLHLGNTNSASVFNVYYDYLLGISKEYTTDWLSADTEAMPDCSLEPPVSLALTEIAFPVVPLSGQPTWTFNSTLSGTMTLFGPCKTETTTVVGGNNSLTFSKMGKGSYGDCILRVTDGEENVVDLAISPFRVDGWAFEPAAGGNFTFQYNAAGAFAIAPID